MSTLFQHSLDGLWEFIPSRFTDERGYFSEVYKKCQWDDVGISVSWVQDNESYSASAGTIRGLHFQTPPKAQHKLIRVLRGAIFDVAIDIRRGSSTYAQWVGVEIDCNKGNQLLVPAGCAHGFMTLVPDTVVQYKVSDYWSAAHEQALRWDDEDLAIDWPSIGVEPTISAKDMSAGSLKDLSSPFSIEERS